MPTLSTNCQQIVAQTTELSPAFKRKLLTELKAYQALKTELDAIIEAMNEHKATIGALRAESGETSLTVDGFKVSLISPAGRASIDKKALLLNGVSMGQIENSMVTKPVKPYEKVLCPGDNDARDN